MTVLLLRADAGPRLGAGHLSRCVAFAEEAVTRGWHVTLSGEIAAGQWLRSLDVPLLPPATDADALAGLAKEVAADLVVVDNYPLGELWPAVRNVGARLISLEDGEFGRRAADIVVDCGLAPPARPDDGSPTVLTGPAFAPLRAAVREAREHRRRGVPAGDPPRVIVALGGGDASAVLPPLLTALRDTGLAMDVLAISSAPGMTPAPRPWQRFAVDGPRADLLRLFAGADLVVSAAGVTLLELCCIGVPTALLLRADNQAAGYRAVVDRHAVAGLGAVEDLIADPAPATEVLCGVLGDPSRRAGLAAAASGLVDGHGARRILDRALSE